MSSGCFSQLLKLFVGCCLLATVLSIGYSQVASSDHTADGGIAPAAPDSTNDATGR